MTKSFAGRDRELIEKLSPEENTIVACVVAFNAAFRVLVSTLQNDGMLRPGQIAEGLTEFVEVAGSCADPLTLKLIDELKQSLLERNN